MRIIIFAIFFFLAQDTYALDSSGLGVSGRLSSNISQSSQGVPIGSIIAWTAHGMPSDGEWMECNGQYHGSTELYNVIGSWYTPNYQGVFLRGYGSQSFSQVHGIRVNNGLPVETIHTSGNLGEIQGDAIRNITGTFGTWNAWHKRNAGGAFRHTKVNDHMSVSLDGPDDTSKWYFDTSLVVPTAEENRPINKAVKYIIKIR